MRDTLGVSGAEDCESQVTKITKISNLLTVVSGGRLVGARSSEVLVVWE